MQAQKMAHYHLRGGVLPRQSLHHVQQPEEYQEGLEVIHNGIEDELYALVLECGTSKYGNDLILDHRLAQDYLRFFH